MGYLLYDTNKYAGDDREKYTSVEAELYSESAGKVQNILQMCVVVIVIQFIFSHPYSLQPLPLLLPPRETC